MITRDFDLWITQGHTKRLVFNANQYDQGETWRFRILGADGNPIVPTTAAIIGQKKDGHAILVQGTVSDGKVVITETEQMTACAGLTEFELLLNGETHGTANFTVQVEKRPGDDADLSDSDLSLIQDAVDAAEVIVEVIGDGDPSEVIGEHVDAWLDAHPEATTTVLDGAITAPKINNSLWDKILVNEEASGNPASFEDGADDVPVSSLKVALEPIQLGSGDPSLSNIRPIVASNGKNLLQVMATSQTINGVTFTVNADGTISLSGTATANTYFYFVNNAPWQTGGQALTVTGCPSGGSYNTYCIIGRHNGSAWMSDIGNGASIPTTTTYITDFGISIQNGVNTNRLVFKPMVRLASITDSSYQPYQGIMVERCGINQWDEQWELGTYDSNTNTIVKIGDTTHIRSKNPISVDAGKTYYMNTAGYSVHIAVADKDKNILWSSITLNNGTFTVPANGAYVYFNTAAAYGTTYNNDISINYPSTITDYHAYNGNSYPYTLGQNVYGGTVDLAIGVLTVTHGFITLNGGTSEAWGYAKLNGIDTFNMTPINGIVPTSAMRVGYDGWCDTFPVSKGAALSNLADNSLYISWYALTASRASILISKNGITTVNDFRTWLAQHNVSVVYPLQTPQTIQLTPTQVKTLLGYNNISSTGTVDVIYHADTKLYVDKMTAVDNNIIAPTEEGFTATRNYTVNDLVIVNDTLYKVTANIATGSAITPNSNVTQTTLGALIKALS